MPGDNANSMWPTGEELGVMSRAYVFQIFKSKPELFISALIALLLLEVFEGILTGELTPQGSAWLRDSVQAGPPYLIGAILFGGYCLDVVVTACVAVCVHRFILLGETSVGLGLVAHGYTWNFVVWIMAVGLLYFIVALPLPVGIWLLILIPIIVLDCRLSLIFPAVAIGSPSAGVAERIRVSWERTRGRVFTLFYGGLVTALPLIAVVVGVFSLFAVAFLVISTTNVEIDADVELLPYFSAALLFFHPISGIYGTCCGAAVASCAYRAAMKIDPGGAPG